MLAELVLLTNIAFNVCFDTGTMVPSWVQYDLEPQEIVRIPRIPMPFHADPRLPMTDVDGCYAKSGYDRGHMAPAADFNFDFNALYETYAFSNIAPQAPRLNRGPWADEEAELRRLAARGTVHVLAIPVTDGSTNWIGAVKVPTRFYKIAWGWFGVRIGEYENR